MDRPRLPITIPDPIMWGYGLILGDFHSRARAIGRGLIWFSIIFKVFFGSSKVTNNHSRPHHVGMTGDVTAVAGGVSSRDLLAWGLRCSMPNQWLEFPDVLLYCYSKNVPLQILVWHEGHMSRCFSKSTELGKIHRNPSCLVVSLSQFSE